MNAKEWREAHAGEFVNSSDMTVDYDAMLDAYADYKAANKYEAELAAERTLREAAERELKELRGNRRGIYMASKTKHADKWKELRAEGFPIICTWIDEAGIGETKSFSNLWVRCISEVSQAEKLIAYAEEGDELKGGLLEIGAALSAGTPVIVVGDIPQLKTAKNHPLISFAETVRAALRGKEGE